MEPVQKAVWFVESHFRQQHSLEEIAQACHVSAYHLTRAFAATTGRSLMRYLRGRRLSEAARQLAQGADDILRVALDTGYGSHEAFTRAFRDQFGMTPEQVRGQGHVTNIHLIEAIAMNTTAVSEIAPDRFETSKPMLVAGLVERYACDATQGIPGQWQRFAPFLGHVKGQLGDAAYGVVYKFDSESNFDYMCGVEVKNADGLPASFQTIEVPSLRYVVFRHTQHVAGIRATITAIWSKWFPQSGCQAVEGPTLERYGPEFNPATGMGGFEIWIPIRE
jgi:AraC family transcriptional regulator